ncbi:lysophospholipid acyltransferase family protein [Salibaculum griseiflavum]|uniref:Acyltransferase n=1 Tax=Salibaculum griseiflavum TaxID=1914409 RepID=A0A2V1P1J1_9RHOB|nr:lysophospholipid acyltransferase family protein [Salibaculum griseiflavum]PWG16399.1 acyltransferase [Salibaculum griseiflavum]
MSDKHIARDISYAHSARSKGGRAMIRVMENATGRLRLIRKARGYAEEVAEGRDFWQVICNRYKIRLEVVGGSLDDIPTQGPLVLVANHPYGILDGLMMGRILSERRAGDFRVLAHKVFRKSPDLERVILPIDFDETKEAAKRNMETRKEALRYLGQGGAIGIFPGGTVSTSLRPFARPMDPAWRTFTAKMIARSDAQVVPVYFEGHNSRLFQLASHLHYTLRMGLLIREFRARVGSTVRVVIGRPIPAEKLDPLRSDPKAMMDFLRKATYELSPSPVAADAIGFEYDDRHKIKAGGTRDNGSGNL